MNDKNLNGEKNTVLNNPIKQYEGSEDYAFVTFSYKDSDRVYPILTIIRDMGINISFNDDIPQENCEDSCLEYKIKESKFFIPFLTQNLVESDSCSIDIFYADFYNVPIIPVFLKETELPININNLIEDAPPILQYTMNSQKFHDKFNALYKSILIKRKGESNQLNKMYFTGIKGETDTEGRPGIFSHPWERIKTFFANGQQASIINPKTSINISPIYLSFSHGNLDLIYGDFEILKYIRVGLIDENKHFELKNNKIEYMYDKEIDFNDLESDSSWFKEVESSIKNCSLFLFYASEKSINSKRRIYELQCAIQEDIPICIVYFEELNQISHSLEKLFEDKPIIHKYNMNEKEYEDAFINQLEKNLSKQTNAKIHIKNLKD